MKLSDPAHESRALKAAQSFLEKLPAAPKGSIKHCSLHWAATPYGWAITRGKQGDVIPYQVVADIDASGNGVLVPGMSPLLNARAIPSGAVADVDYCASVWRRNSHGVAVSASAMLNAGPRDFGKHPLNELLVEFLCAGAAALCTKYELDASAPESCFTHAEAAIWDKYFLGDDPDCRWDLAIFKATQASTEQLKAQAIEMGDHLRKHIRRYKLKLLGRGHEDAGECRFCASALSRT